MIIPIKTSPRKTLSKVEKKFFFFFFLAGVVFFLGCLLGAGVGSDGSATTAFFSRLADGTGSTFGKVLVSVISSKTTLASRR